MDTDRDIYALLDSYSRGELSSEEISAVEKWIGESDGNREIAGDILKINFLTDTLDPSGETKARLAFDQVTSAIRRRKIGKALLRVRQAAAVVALPLLVVCTWLFISVRKEYNADIEIHSATGMISSVVLPDSTRVWLNSNSTLIYPARFTGKERRVALEGEGFFEVAPEKKRFIVDVGPAKIEVYGTRFNIEAYPDAQDIRAMLVSGNIGVNYEDLRGGTTLAILEPGQMLTYNRSGRHIWTSTVDTEVETSWKGGGKSRIWVDAAAGAQRMVGNKYNVNFMITDAALLDHTFMGTFSGHTLDAVLTSFTLSSDIHFRKVPQQNGGEYTGREIIEVY
ncbi:MAG: FecR domain-containing protein [Rikenellaceae bacterium]|nr:FecR domain-containing protein [Rikenellaceae bacterium]